MSGRSRGPQRRLPAGNFFEFNPCRQDAGATKRGSLFFQQPAGSRLRSSLIRSAPQANSTCTVLFLYPQIYATPGCTSRYTSAAKNAKLLPRGSHQTLTQSAPQRGDVSMNAAQQALVTRYPINLESVSAAGFRAAHAVAANGAMEETCSPPPRGTGERITLVRCARLLRGLRTFRRLKRRSPLGIRPRNHSYGA